MLALLFFVSHMKYENIAARGSLLFWADLISSTVFHLKVPGQRPEPRLQVANIAQYFYFRNILLKFKSTDKISGFQ